MVHLLSGTETREHRMHPLARVVGGHLVYEGGQMSLPGPVAQGGGEGV